MSYFVYILQSNKDKNLYIGCTSKHPKEREKEHNSGMVASTKHRRSLKLVHTEGFLNKGDAYKREWHLKHPKGYKDKLKIIKNLGL